MVPTETWRVACGALRANKLRAFLTMLGVVIGSASIVLVVTVALTGRRYIVQQIEAVGSNLVYAELVHTGSSQPTALGDEITPEDLDALRQDIPQIVEVAGTHDIPMTVVVGGVEHPVSLIGVTEGFQRIRNLAILRGRYFDPDDMESHSKVCLLIQNLANLVFPAEDPVGEQIHVGEFSFTVIGVFRERVATFGESEITGKSILVPFPLTEYYTGQNIIRTLYAQADRPEDVPSVTRQVTEILKSRHRAGAEYRVQNLTSLLDAARQISLALTIVLLLLALIALTISGVGIMNIMLVSVTERTHEIGIRRAVGAHRADILYQFLTEAVLISASGAAVGISIAISVPLLTRLLITGNLSIPISWLSVVVAFGVSCLTGVVFGYLPANRAAHLQPTESLRYE